MDSVKNKEAGYLVNAQRKTVAHWIGNLNSTSIFTKRDAQGNLVVVNAKTLEDIFEQIDYEKAVLLNCRFCIEGEA